MPRKLSEVEKQYIEANYLKESVDKMASKMKGVGPVTVQEYVDTLPPPPEPGETPEERRRKLQNTKVAASNFMGRDKERGVTVMTPAAAELIDARDTVSLPEVTERRKKAMKGKIHRPFEESEHDR